MTTYATSALGKFTERRRKEDGKNRSLAVYIMWGLFNTLRLLYDNLTSEKQSLLPRKPQTRAFWSLKGFYMYGLMRMSVPSLHRESLPTL